MNDKCIIGAFGVTFNQRAAFIYLAASEIKGYFVRKANWHHLLNQFDEIAYRIKQNVLVEYILKIRSKVNIAKQKDIDSIKDRKDH